MLGKIIYMLCYILYDMMIRIMVDVLYNDRDIHIHCNFAQKLGIRTKYQTSYTNGELEPYQITEVVKPLTSSAPFPIWYFIDQESW